MLDFIGIGAQKAGTTWLYEALAAHPAVRFPAGKEVHFWDRHRARGVDWYRGQFAGDGAKNGEITPAYAVLPPAAIRELHGVNPALRVLYTLRNPIARAWSAALMVLARNRMALEGTPDQWFIDHFRSENSLTRGDYETSLRNWRAVFAGQILVLRYETLCEDPRGYLEACCRHIGVDADFYRREAPAILGRRVFDAAPAPLRGSLRPVLLEIYAPRISALGAYLGADLRAWLDADA